MYFQTPFPVPSLKQLSAKFLHHWKGKQNSRFCLLLALMSPNIQKAYDIGIIESTGPQQHTGTSLAFIRCVVPEIELFSLFSPMKTVPSQEKLSP